VGNAQVLLSMRDPDGTFTFPPRTATIWQRTKRNKRGRTAAQCAQQLTMCLYGRRIAAEIPWIELKTDRKGGKREDSRWTRGHPLALVEYTRKRTHITPPPPYLHHPEPLHFP